MTRPRQTLVRDDGRFVEMFRSLSKGETLIQLQYKPLRSEVGEIKADHSRNAQTVQQGELSVGLS